jgi:hypothetical protein
MVNESERAKNRTKSKVRAKVEHPIGVIQAGVRFRQVALSRPQKNTQCLVVTCALANLFMARLHLLRFYWCNLSGFAADDCRRRRRHTNNDTATPPHCR